MIVDKFNGILQQIETLDKIANSFSEFATMPAAEPDLVDVKEVVRNSVYIFPEKASLSIEEGPELLSLIDKDQ